MTPVPLASFFAEHDARTRNITSQYPHVAVDKDTPTYLQPYIDYTTLRWKIPDRELHRFNDQWDALYVTVVGHREAKWGWETLFDYSPSNGDVEHCEQWVAWKVPTGEPGSFETKWLPMIRVSVGGEPSAQWPNTPYSFSQGYSEAYEEWLAALPPEAQAVEKKNVCDRFHAEYSNFVKAVLYFQILWSDPNDPQLVTPANWDDEGSEIAQRYNHRAPAKEHWLLPMAEVFAIYNPTPPVQPEGGQLNCNADESTRDESIQRPVNRPTSKGGKPTDPE